MKQIFTIIITFLCFNICYGIEYKLPKPIDVREAAQEMIKDPHFAEIIRTTYKLRSDLASELSKAGNEVEKQFSLLLERTDNFNSILEFYTTHGMNAELLEQGQIDQISSFYFLFTENASLAELSEETRHVVLKEAFQLLKDPKFIEQNEGVEAIKVIDQIVQNNSTAQKLTREEAFECVGQAVIGAFAAFGGLVATIVGIASGQGLTRAALNSTIRSAIRIGMFAAGGTTIGYMIGCLIWEAIW